MCGFGQGVQGVGAVQQKTRLSASLEHRVFQITQPDRQIKQESRQDTNAVFCDAEGGT